MAFFEKVLKIKLFPLIFFSALLVIAIFSWLYFITDSTISPKASSIYGGILAGLIVAVLQMFLSRFEFSKIQKFTDLKIIDIMAHRDNRDYYEKLITDAKQRIWMMGVTAYRFKEHFADTKSTIAKNKILITALSKGVETKIMLPKPDYLDTSTKKENERDVIETFKEIKQTYTNKFEYKYFEHVPMHSIFIVDNTCIVGPVFQKVSSKDTPAIVIDVESPLAKQYLKYFEEEWDKAIQVP